ncbi:MAG: hypothetical protein ABI689_14165 [Thermoanaerobaculia bacterium]
MTRHDDRIRLRHMLDHGREAVASDLPPMIEAIDRFLLRPSATD